MKDNIELNLLLKKIAEAILIKNVNVFFNKSRQRDIAFGRQLFLYLAKKIYDNPLFTPKYLTDYIECDNSYFYYAENSIKGLILTDKHIKNIVDDLLLLKNQK